MNKVLEILSISILSYIVNGLSFCDSNEWEIQDGEWNFDGSIDKDIGINNCALSSTSIESNNVALIELNDNSEICDFSIEFVLNMKQNVDNAGIFVRSNNDGNNLNGYYYGIVPSTQMYMFGYYLVNDDNFYGDTFSINDVTISYNTNFLVKITAMGSVITLYINDVFQQTITNSIYSCGTIAFITVDADAIFSQLQYNEQDNDPYDIEQEVDCDLGSKEFGEDIICSIDVTFHDDEDIIENNDGVNQHPVTITSIFNLIDSTEYSSYCDNPRITYKYIENDFDSHDEYIHLYESNTGSLIANCGINGEDETCQLETCITDRSLNDDYSFSSFIKIRAYVSAAVDGIHHDGITEVCEGGNKVESTLILTCARTEIVECPNIFTFNWDELIEYGNDREPEIPEIYNLNMNVNEQDLSLNIEVELQYIGHSSTKDAHNILGVTYVLDFEDFDAYNHAISEPGTCQNRDADDFKNVPFEDIWKYSNNPTYANQIGSTKYLEYPPGNLWTLTANDCDSISYTASFTWQQLRDCTAFNGGNSYTHIRTDENWLNLTGMLYINIVSPYSYKRDYGYYRVYQLLSQPFVIAISSSVYLLSSTGINVMTMSVIAVYKEQIGNIFELVLLTETSEYMKLSNPTILDTTIKTVEFSAIPIAETRDNCLNNKDYVCSQMWRIEAKNVLCVSNSDDGNVGGIDFSGIYSLHFDIICRNGDNGYNFASYCDEWLDEHIDIRDNGALLQTRLKWKDEICDPKLFDVQFTSNMLFYPNDSYIEPIEDDYLYQVGQDRIYVELKTNFPSDAYEIFDITLKNVWLCTFAPDAQPKSPDKNTLNGGCFDKNRDENDDPFAAYYFHIYQKAIVEFKDQGFEFHPISDDAEQKSSMMRFSFIVPSDIARDTLYIHVEVEVNLSELSTRRILLDNDRKTANQIGHIGDEINVFIPLNVIKPYDNDYNNNKKPNYVYSNNDDTSLLSSPWAMLVVGLVALMIVSNMLMICYMKLCNGNQQHRFRRRISMNSNRREGYQSVKPEDSELSDLSQHDDKI